ncbi:MAG: hypothetical protein JNJ42_17225 [Burkholderiaceae bacterium]|jgi:hypothetical protein|nr:hypothetical protein [Burkholderiaceae bacterium]
MSLRLRPNRLQIATRLHFVLMRELGQGIDVGRMLKHEVYARDVLLVCDAFRGHELEQLSKAFRVASDEPAPTAAAPLSTYEYRDSQFAAPVTGPAAMPPVAARDKAPAAARTWFDRILR